MYARGGKRGGKEDVVMMINPPPTQKAPMPYLSLLAHTWDSLDGIQKLELLCVILDVGINQKRVDL